MCRRTTCRTCGQPSWAGCGAHVEAVLGDVHPDDRCRCAEERASARSAAGAGVGRASLLQRLLGR